MLLLYFITRYIYIYWRPPPSRFLPLPAFRSLESLPEIHLERWYVRLPAYSITDGLESPEDRLPSVITVADVSELDADSQQTEEFRVSTEVFDHLEDLASRLAVPELQLSPPGEPDTPSVVLYKWENGFSVDSGSLQRDHAEEFLRMWNEETLPEDVIILGGGSTARPVIRMDNSTFPWRQVSWMEFHASYVPAKPRTGIPSQHCIAAMVEDSGIMAHIRSRFVRLAYIFLGSMDLVRQVFVDSVSFSPINLPDRDPDPSMMHKPWPAEIMQACIAGIEPNHRRNLLSTHGIAFPCQSCRRRHSYRINMMRYALLASGRITECQWKSATGVPHIHTSHLCSMGDNYNPRFGVLEPVSLNQARKVCHRTASLNGDGCIVHNPPCDTKILQDIPDYYAWQKELWHRKHFTFKERAKCIVDLDAAEISSSTQTKGPSPNTPTVSSIVPLTKPTVSTLSLTDPIETDPIVSTDGRLGSSTTPSVSTADAVGHVVGILPQLRMFPTSGPYGTTMIPLPLSVLSWTGSRAIRLGVERNPGHHVWARKVVDTAEHELQEIKRCSWIITNKACLFSPYGKNCAACKAAARRCSKQGLGKKPHSRPTTCLNTTDVYLANCFQATFAWLFLLQSLY